MFLTEEQINLRLNSSENLINIKKHDDENPTIQIIKWQGANGHGRRDSPDLTEGERLAAGILAKTIGAELASDIIGISEGHAKHLAQGRVNSVDIDIDYKEKLDSSINNTLQSAESKAADRLLAALGFITDEKMQNLGAKDLSAVAANMSRTVAGIRPQQDDKNKGNKVVVIIQQPKPSREEHFEIIEVSA